MDAAERPDRGNNGDDQYHPLLLMLLDRIRYIARESGEPEAAAAAASALWQPRGNGNNNNDDDNDDDDDEQQNVENDVEIRKAKNVLEITGGDVDLAAQLYWDDFLATRAHRRQQQQQQQQQQQRQQQQRRAQPQQNHAPNHHRHEMNRAEEIHRRNEPGDDEEDEDEDEDMADQHDDGDQGVGVGDRPGRGAPEMIGDRPPEDEDYVGAGRYVRRRLEGLFDRQARRNRRNGQDEGDEEDEEDEEDVDHQNLQNDVAGAGVDLARIIAQARESARMLDGGGGVGGGENADPPGADAVARVARAFLAGRGIGEVAGGSESVSVSDDESGGVWRISSGGQIPQPPRRGGQGRRQQDPLAEERAKRKRRKLEATETASSPSPDERGGDDTQEYIEGFAEEDGYLSDNDWLWDSSDQSDPVPLYNPVDLLWGSSVSASSNDDSEVASAGRAGPVSVAANPPQDPPGNVIADDYGDDEDDDEDANNEESGRERNVGIPNTWLRAGFTLSECTTGLAVQPPSQEDLANFAWQQQAAAGGNGSGINLPPPPFHCRAVTALLSIVTGLLYTGATVQVHEIFPSAWGNDDQHGASSRKPWAELTKDERKRQFESRLADALTALLFVAAKTSVERKKKALSSPKRSMDPLNQRSWQQIQRKLRLCPTCWWKSDPTTGEPILPHQQLSNGVQSRKAALQISVSYTNMDSLRAYVLSNLKSFTARGGGGCALFLECIMRIHGKGAVRWMMLRARSQVSRVAGTSAGRGTAVKSSSESSNTSKSLSMIHCTCEEQHRQKMEENPQLARSLMRNNNQKQYIDTTPPRHDCVAIELVSLLLTGQVHSTLRNWSTGPLGLGILSDRPGEVGSGLLRPCRPVWVLRGPTCYSVMWLNGSHDHHGTFSIIDRPGSVAMMTHWNCWYYHSNDSSGNSTNTKPAYVQPQQNRTILKVVANRSRWNPPKPGCSRAAMERLQPPSSCCHPKTTMTMESVARRRLLRQEEKELSEGNSGYGCTAAPMGVVTTDDEDAGGKTSGALVPSKGAAVVAEKAMELVTFNPDDAKFYPGRYRMWRYDMGRSQTVPAASHCANEPHQQHPDRNEMKKAGAVGASNGVCGVDIKRKALQNTWIPYHRLTDHEKFIVETKLGPKINTILWTRWPQATIDQQEPSPLPGRQAPQQPPPPVV